MAIFTGLSKQIPYNLDLLMNIAGVGVSIAGFVLSVFFQYDFNSDVMMTLLGVEGMLMMINGVVVYREVGCCKCCKGGPALAIVMVTLAEFFFLFYAVICGVYGSELYDKKYWIYTPNTEMCSTDNTGIVPFGCFNETHTCAVDAPGDDNDYGTCNEPCWQHTDTLLFAVTMVISSISLCLVFRKQKLHETEQYEHGANVSEIEP
mmetsp:Transcript_12820/g.19656  ORF Transcript_12820/g.19656 Transcript_12820/m.19656 type:complete len:205 (-) Transcript_12820:232-846(-)